jgi:hypothetical protein
VETTSIFFMQPCDRTVKRLYEANLCRDNYHDAIAYAAKTLLDTLRICKKSKVACSDYRCYIYVTQYQSGATVWRNPNIDGATVLVDLNGNISDERKQHEIIRKDYLVTGAAG